MNQNKKNVPRWLKVLVGLSIIASVVAIGLYVNQFNSPLSPRQEIWGQFGDYIGGTLNPLFAFTALLALLYTIVLQSRELRNSAEQLKKSADALDKQNSVLKKQSFEATFFQLLKLYSDIVQELHVIIEDEDELGSRTSVRYEDRKCIRALYTVLLKEHFIAVDRGDFTEPRPVALNIKYHEFYKKYGELVGHYFRIIYNIIKIVDNSDINESEKKNYTNLLRAQLSKYELCLIHYNAISDYGREKMLPLIIKYVLLKHLDSNDLAISSDIKLLDGSNL